MNTQTAEENTQSMEHSGGTQVPTPSSYAEWNGVDIENGHPYADLVAVAREIANDPKCDLIYSERRMRLYAALRKLSALD